VTSNLACSWNLPEHVIKSHPEEKVGVALARELPKFSGFLQWLKLVTSNLVHSLGLPRPFMKSPLKEKWSSPIFGGSH